MTKLYPIGTTLVTHEPWKGFLLARIFGCQNENASISAFEFDVKESGVFLGAREGRIVVTPENQELLSPIPVVGDLVSATSPDEQDANIIYGDTYRRFEGVFVVRSGVNQRPIDTCENINVIQRTYNGTRYPFTGGWDEVIEPEECVHNPEYTAWKNICDKD